MKIYIDETGGDRESGGRSSGAGLSAQPGASWVRFGRDTVVYAGDELEAEPPAAQQGSRAARPVSRHVEATPDQLHVVVQNGRLFQQHNPDVPVLHDRGRFLLVQLDPERAKRLHAEGETCFGLVPLAADHVVFEERPRARARASVPFVKALADRLTRDSVEANLTTLVSFGTRHSTSAGHASAAKWARSQFDEMGYTTAVQSVPVNGGTSRNVIADRTGSGPDTRRLVIVTAHLDSINLAGGPTAPAPGADDNGSGSAGAIEIARVLKDHRAVHDLRFILFGGEEEGLFGSKHYVSKLPAAERARIQAVVNMDMVGSLNSPSRSVLLEGASLSQSVIDGLSEAASTYTQLTVETSLHPFASDHVPFIEAGLPAVLTIEGSDNTNSTVHSANDTLEKIDYALLLEILRMNVGFVAGTVGRAS